MLSRISFLILVMFVVISCGPDTTSNSSTSTKTSTNTSTPVSPPAVQQDVDPGKTNLKINLNQNQLQYSDYLANPRLVSLKIPANKNMEYLNKVIVTDKYIFALDNGYGNFFVFDRDGNYIDDLRSQKDEVYEYMTFDDFDYDFKRNILYMLDSDAYTIATISPEFKLLKKQDQPFMWNKISYYNNNFHYYFEERGEASGFNHNVEIKEMEKLKTIKQQFPVDTRYTNINFMPRISYAKANDNLYVIPLFRNQVYRFNNKKMEYELFRDLNFMEHDYDDEVLFYSDYEEFTNKTIGKFAFEEFWIVDEKIYLQGRYNNSGGSPFVIIDPKGDKIFGYIKPDYVRDNLLNPNAPSYVNLDDYKDSFLHEVMTGIKDQNNGKIFHLVEFDLKN